MAGQLILFGAKYHSIVWMDHYLLILSPTEGFFGCSQVLSVMDNKHLLEGLSVVFGLFSLLPLAELSFCLRLFQRPLTTL